MYPGAHHTRFHHAIGAMHLMNETLENLKTKGVEISDEEMEATLIAILLHDIGHGPFSHALEFTLLKDVAHESISLLTIAKLNEELKGRLALSLQIFQGAYHRKFLNQLVSSQLDIDRLDYLKRDSYFTGVSEGTIGAERIIKMLDVKDDELVVEEKGIYSIENFLSARRLMYWQVYLHKTSVSSEKMLIGIIKRAKRITQKGEDIFATPALKLFLQTEFKTSDFEERSDILEAFLDLDDYDLWGAIKIWSQHSDLVLSKLCQMLLKRHLFKIRISQEPVSVEEIEKISSLVQETYGVTADQAQYFYSTGQLTNNAYLSDDQKIMILSKSGEVRDVVEAADLPNIKAMSKIVRKYYRCWPKDISL